MGLRNILLIDESQALLNACKIFLNGQCHPIRVLDQHLAAELLDKKLVDVVVLSSQTKDSDALEYLTLLKKRFPSPAYIFVGHQPTPDLILTAFRSNINDFIRDPVDPSTLFASLCRQSHIFDEDGAVAFDLYHLNVTDFRNVVEEISADRSKGSTMGSGRRNNVPRFEHIIVAARWLLNILLRVAENIRLRRGTTTVAPQTAIVAGGIVSNSLQLFAGRHGDAKRADIRPDSPAVEGELRVHFFGHFRVVANNTCLATWCSHKAKLLFAYLLLNHKRMHCRDVLMDKFWPNTQPSSARNNLNVVLHAIRQRVHDIEASREYILFKEESYYINPEIAVWVDVEEFMSHWQRSRKGQARINIPEIIQELEAARKLYTADFMEDELYDEWVSLERENLKETYLDTLDRLSDCYVLSNNPIAAVQLCETILEKDSCREDIHRRLMLCYYRLG